MESYVSTGGELSGDVLGYTVLLAVLLVALIVVSIREREWKPAGIGVVLLGCLYLWPVATIGLAILAVCVLIVGVNVFR